MTREIEVENREMYFEEIVSKATAYITKLFEGNSGGHDAAHTLRVYRNAMLIADKEPTCNRELVALGALLHDVDDHKLFQTKDNENARKFLGNIGINELETEEICKIINSVSFSQNKGKKPETLEAMIVQDADRIDAIGALGIARTFAYGGEHGRSLDESIDHFHEKLLLLKDLLNTESAKAVAQKRHQFMLDFLAEYEEETKKKC